MSIKKPGTAKPSHGLNRKSPYPNIAIPPNTRMSRTSRALRTLNVGDFSKEKKGGKGFCMVAV